MQATLQVLEQLVFLQLSQAAYSVLEQQPSPDGSDEPRQPKVVEPSPPQVWVVSARQALNSVQQPGVPFTQVGQDAKMTVPMLEPQYG